MDVSNLLAENKSYDTCRTPYLDMVHQPGDEPMRQGGHPPFDTQADGGQPSALHHAPHLMANPVEPTAQLCSPTDRLGKHVTFELLLHEAPAHRARLPMRVNICPHDTTESIITTVKNFYGLYEKRGVCFENATGETLIARYENFEHNMIVYVRAIGDDPDTTEEGDAERAPSRSPRRPRLDEPFHMLPPPLGHHQTPSRPSSRVARKRSVSPQSAHSRRSASTNAHGRSRPRLGPRGPSSHNSFTEPNGDATGFSDSDAGASVTSSRRAKNDALATSEISLENIVEGGRRKRAKFDSSELPLFIPPQVPMTASISSVSPQRKMDHPSIRSPYAASNQQTFSYTHPLPSPQSYGHSDHIYTQPAPMSMPFSAPPGRHGHRLRARGGGQYPSRHSMGIPGVLPTPDPTIGGSVISDEDAALQLMRLGDVSNFSSHGRTSTSTVDDALSGKAEAASSGDDTDASDVEDDRRDAWAGAHASDAGSSSGGEHEQHRQTHDLNLGGQQIRPIDDAYASQPAAKKPRLSKPTTTKATKPRGPSTTTTKKHTKISASSASRTPISPTSLPSQSRKPSIASTLAQSAATHGAHPHALSAPPPPPPLTLAEDEEDLSSKPRCQRCRKSKKGCDRQRPCGRCRDAGLGAADCISEEEGNGRKGRYGRHMGVVVKKTAGPGASAATSAAGSPTTAVHGGSVSDASMAGPSVMSAGFALGVAGGGEKGKKRKR